MAWNDDELHIEVLGEFASHMERQHREEWAWWAGHDERARAAVESERLNVGDIRREVHDEYLAPQKIRGLDVYSLKQRVDEAREVEAERVAKVYKVKHKKRETSAQASRRFYDSVRSNPELLFERNLNKRRSRFDRRHEGQNALIED